MNISVIDGLFSNELLVAANSSWPHADWPGWVLNDPRQPGKRVSGLADPLPRACAVLLAQMALLPQGNGLIPDLGLWGAGLHEMPVGTSLDRHLDADVHGRLGLSRKLSAVLWIHDQWHREWGGELAFDSGLIVQPMPGRMVLFDSQGEWHCVNRITAPATLRLSLAMFWYSSTAPKNSSTRAFFQPRLLI